jgi:MTH538 TIR-like domain (DUF1863)
MSKRVYFAFHYQDVIDFRANVVRKHNFTEGVEAAGYYDHSIWETAKRTNPTALKRLINSELEGASVTAVLIGSLTHDRPWVRYEIIHSLSRGSALLGVHINSIKGKDQLTKSAGPNPFDYLGVTISNDGRRASPTEYRNGKWIIYSEHDGWTLARPHTAENVGKHFQLSKWYPTYDWVHNDGFNNFSTWIS